MLKRIAVIGGSDVGQGLAKAAEESGAQLLSIASGENVPAGCGALLGAAEAGSLPTALAFAKANEGLLRILADAVDSREGLLVGSSARLCEHAARFAKVLGLDTDEQYALERGALLHDVGKILISNEVLMKKSVLDYDDWLLLQAHTTLGADLLEEHGVHTDVCDIVRYHHECWNGEGYPERLEKGAIPRLALAMKVLDVYCAMTSPRHYRSTHASHDDAIAHLKEERGERYCAEMVDAFLENDIGQPFKSA
jgi:putative nucleotidyltransferase with HDIG domain